jgi:hypothetical protein
MLFAYLVDSISRIGEYLDHKEPNPVELGLEKSSKLEEANPESNLDAISGTSLGWTFGTLGTLRTSSALKSLALRSPTLQISAYILRNWWSPPCR